MIIEADNYKVWYEKEKNTVFFKGSLRLWDPAGYHKIKQMLCDIYSLEAASLDLDFRELEFLNSSGISTLCRFIFDAKEMKPKRLKIIGNNEILWQKKSFENLRKIWDSIILEFK